MKTIIGLIAGLTLSTQLMAECHAIDVFGTSDVIAEKIVQKYGKKLLTLEDNMLALVKNPDTPLFNQKAEKMQAKKDRIMKQIQQEYGFLFTSLELVVDPDLARYSTIDVINKGDDERLKHVEPVKPITHAPAKNDIIDKMKEYQDVSFQLMVNQEISGRADCPFYHCAAGFDHPKLKPYLSVFRNITKQEKQTIIDTLNDPDPERRANAIFLAGHFKDPKEIIRLITPHVHDDYSEVRNDATRVVATTLFTAGIHDIDIQPFLELLDYPYVTDRNKALLVMLATTKSPKVKNELIKKGKKPLIALLELKQPNNHLPAYRILKEISGKDFGEYDITSWQNWFDSQNKNV